MSIGTSVSFINIKGTERGASVSPEGWGTVIADFTLQCEGTAAGIRCRNSDLVVGNGRIDDPTDGIEMGTGGGSARITLHDIQIYGTNRSGAAALRLQANGDTVSVSDVDILGTGFPSGVRLGNDASIADGSFYIKNCNLMTCGYLVNPSSNLAKLSIIGGSITGATNDIRFESVAGLVQDFVYRDIESDNTGVQISVSTGVGLPKKVDMNFMVPEVTTSGSVNTFFGTPIQDNTAYRLSVDSTAMQSDGSEAATYNKFALIRRNGAGAVIEGAMVTPIADIESTGATGWSADITTGGNDMRARVIGAAATTINWRVRLSITSMA